MTVAQKIDGVAASVTEPRCEWCGKLVDPETGVRLRAGKFATFLVCHEHASAAKEYAKASALMLAASIKHGAKAYIQRRFPFVKSIAGIAKFLVEPTGE